MNITFPFKHACRLLSRMRPYTFINVLGLVVSLTGAIIIARYVHQELTVDHYIPLLDRTFMLTNVQDEGTPINERGKDVSSAEISHLCNIMACFSPN